MVTVDCECVVDLLELAVPRLVTGDTSIGLLGLFISGLSPVITRVIRVVIYKYIPWLSRTAGIYQGCYG